MSGTCGRSTSTPWASGRKSTRTVLVKSVSSPSKMKDDNTSEDPARTVSPSASAAASIAFITSTDALSAPVIYRTSFSSPPIVTLWRGSGWESRNLTRSGSPSDGIPTTLQPNARAFQKATTSPGRSGCRIKMLSPILRWCVRAPASVCTIDLARRPDPIAPRSLRGRNSESGRRMHCAPILSGSPHSAASTRSAGSSGDQTG